MMKGKGEKMVVVYLKGPSLYLVGETKENCTKPQPGHPIFKLDNFIN
jgi:hypothetical protein